MKSFLVFFFYLTVILCDDLELCFMVKAPPKVEQTGLVLATGYFPPFPTRKFDLNNNNTSVVHNNARFQLLRQTNNNGLVVVAPLGKPFNFIEIEFVAGIIIGGGGGGGTVLVTTFQDKPVKQLEHTVNIASTSGGGRFIAYSTKKARRKAIKRINLKVPSGVTISSITCDE